MSLIHKRAVQIVDKSPTLKNLTASMQELWIMGFETGAKDQALRIAKSVNELANDPNLKIDERQILKVVASLIADTSEMNPK